MGAGALPGPAFAQTLAAAASPATPAAARRPIFLADSSYYFQWAALSTPDVRFRWEPRIGFETALLDYHRGALRLVGDYDAVIGRERRRFDVNHGNYVLEMSTSLRTPVAELSGVFHHVSRHLTDRTNLPAISWNAFGARAERRVTRGPSTMSVRVDVAGVGQRAFVDYVWTSDLRVAIERPAGTSAKVFASATGSLIGVDRTRLDRKRQCGAAVEGGVRLKGKAAAMELFLGYERRIDAFPGDRFRVRMVQFGFRVRG